MNFVDVFIVVFIAYLIWQGYRTGLVGGLLNLLATIAAFVLSTVFYPYLGGFLESKFNFNENISPIIGFIICLVLLEFTLSFLLTFLYSKIAPLYKKSKTIAKVDKYLGVIPSVLVGLFLVSVLMVLVLVLPVKSWLRTPVQESWWGQNVASRGISQIQRIEKILNRVPYKNLVYVLTPTNSVSEDIQELNLPENIVLNEDPGSEKEMFDLVNKERKASGLNQLKFSNALAAVGRAHCSDMFKRNYFSHYTIEGKSPFDRIQEALIDYIAAGENLAYAPSVPIAHQGLMNSPGHRENILRAEFGTLGVGVIDGGINGKMFCQEFTN